MTSYICSGGQGERWLKTAQVLLKTASKGAFSVVVPTVPTCLSIPSTPSHQGRTQQLIIQLQYAKPEEDALEQQQVPLCPSL